MSSAIEGFLAGLVASALDQVLRLLGSTLLMTPDPGSVPRLEELWRTAWAVSLAAYGVLVVAGGLIVMGRETVQTHTTIREVGPRIVIGFIAVAASLRIASETVQIANSLTAALAGPGLNSDTTAEAVRAMLIPVPGAGGGPFLALLGVVLTVVVVAVLITYLVRLAVTLVLVAAAPLFLMFHALPQTDAIARWWWRAFAGCLAVQILQSVTLVVAVRVFFTPAAVDLTEPSTPPGSTTVSGAVVNTMVAIALMWVLFQIPGVVSRAVGFGGGRSLIASLVKGVLIAKTLGAAHGALGSARPHRRRTSTSTSASTKREGSGRGSADPYRRLQVNRRGQYLLPLGPLVRVRRRSAAGAAGTASTNGPRPTTWSVAPPPRTPRSRWVQPRLPADGVWPEHRPILQRDGQYRLPITVPGSPPARRRRSADRPTAPVDDTVVRPLPGQQALPGWGRDWARRRARLTRRTDTAAPPTLHTPPTAPAPAPAVRPDNDGSDR